MRNIELVVKCYVLLFLENTLENKLTDSRELVKETLKSLEQKNGTRQYTVSADEDPTSVLLIHIGRVIEGDESELTHEYVLSTIRLLYGDTNIYSSVKSMVDPNNPPELIKSTILTIRNYLKNVIKREHVERVIKQAYRKIVTANGGSTNSPSEIAQSVILELEGLAAHNNSQDPAIVTRVSFENIDTVIDSVERSKAEETGKKVLKLGWAGINEMTQGGIRLGTFTTIVGLQHGYKSGLGRTVFAQIATSNDAFDLGDKKPLLLYVSLEDPIHYTTDFLYTYFKYAEDNELPNIKETSAEEISTYLTNKLTARGWYIDMVRVNPSDWSYRDLLNMILEYESQGYEVVMMLTDYLSKLPTTGCDKSGAPGTDYQDMFRRVRNAISSKDIAFITPHQFNTETKNLWASGLRGHDLLDVVVGSGPYAKSKQLDVEVDLELYLSVFTQGGKTYLAVQRGKHRGTGIIPEAKKRYILPFPPAAPIPPDPKDGPPIGGRTLTEIHDKDTELDI